MVKNSSPHVLQTCSRFFSCTIFMWRFRLSLWMVLKEHFVQLSGCNVSFSWTFLRWRWKHLLYLAIKEHLSHWNDFIFSLAIVLLLDHASSFSYKQKLIFEIWYMQGTHARNTFLSKYVIEQGHTMKMCVIDRNISKMKALRTVEDSGGAECCRINGKIANKALKTSYFHNSHSLPLSSDT